MASTPTTSPSWFNWDCCEALGEAGSRRWRSRGSLGACRTSPPSSPSSAVRWAGNASDQTSSSGPTALTIGLAGWGRLSWLSKVADPTIDEIRAEAEAQGIGETTAADALLVPPERRGPLNDAVLPDHLIHMAVFVGQVGAVWTVEKAIEAMLRRLAGAVRRASGRQRRGAGQRAFGSSLASGTPRPASGR